MSGVRKPGEIFGNRKPRLFAKYSANLMGSVSLERASSLVDVKLRKMVSHVSRESSISPGCGERAARRPGAAAETRHT